MHVIKFLLFSILSTTNQSSSCNEKIIIKLKSVLHFAKNNMPKLYYSKILTILILNLNNPN